MMKLPKSQQECVLCKHCALVDLKEGLVHDIVWLLVSTNNIILYINYFFYKDYLCFFINFIDYSRYIYYLSKPWDCFVDYSRYIYSRYIYYLSKPWGCFVCICMCVILLKTFL